MGDSERVLSGFLGGNDSRKSYKFKVSSKGKVSYERPLSWHPCNSSHTKVIANPKSPFSLLDSTTPLHSIPVLLAEAQGVAVSLLGCFLAVGL